MLTIYPLGHYSMSEDEFVEKACYMDLSPEEIEQIRKYESIPLDKIKEQRRILNLKNRAKELTRMHFDERQAGMYNLVFPENQNQPTPSNGSVESSSQTQMCGPSKGCTKKELRPPVPFTITRKPMTKLTGNRLKAWKKKNCNNREDFFGLMRIVTDNTRAVARGIIGARDLLRYMDSSIPPDLSKIGGGIWLVTFAFQYCVNPDKNEKRISYFFKIVQNIFLDVVKRSKLLVENAVNFGRIINRTRDNCKNIIVNLANTYGFDLPPEFEKLEPKKEFIPRQDRPHLKIKTREEIERGGSVRSPRGDSGSITEESRLQPLDDDFFTIRWTNRNLIFRRELERFWSDFCDLPLDDRWYFYKVFMVGQLWLVENAVGRFHHGTLLVAEVESIVEGKNRQKTIKTTMKAVTGAMYDFIKNEKDPNNPNEVDVTYLKTLCDELWSNVVSISKTADEFIELAIESFDMIKICYKYCTNFYHWDLPPFKSALKESKSLTILKRQKKCRLWCEKKKCCRKNKSLSLEYFLEISEFTNSIYQDIVTQHEVEAEAMGLRLEIP